MPRYPYSEQISVQDVLEICEELDFRVDDALSETNELSSRANGLTVDAIISHDDDSDLETAVSALDNAIKLAREIITDATAAKKEIELTLRDAEQYRDDQEEIEDLKERRQELLEELDDAQNDSDPDPDVIQLIQAEIDQVDNAIYQLGGI